MVKCKQFTIDGNECRLWYTDPEPETVSDEETDTTEES